MFFPQFLGECQGITLSKVEARIAISKFFSLCKLGIVWLYICRVMPPPGANPIAVKLISIIAIISINSRMNVIKESIKDWISEGNKIMKTISVRGQ